MISKVGDAGTSLRDKEKAQAQNQTHTNLVPDVLNRMHPERMALAHELLVKLTRRDILDEIQTEKQEPFVVPAAMAPVKRALTEEEKATFEREGFVRCRGWFTKAEIALLRKAIDVTDVTTDKEKKVYVVKDAGGRDTKLVLWRYLGLDTFSLFGRSASLVQAAADLMGGSEPFIKHSKLLLKEPRTGGAWEWHQDFAYWHHQGVLQPDKIFSAIVCISLLSLRIVRTCSHRLGAGGDRREHQRECLHAPHVQIPSSRPP